MADDEVKPEAEFITMGELARRVGINPRTVQRLRKRGVFPPGIFVQVGSARLIRVNWPAFKVWLKDFDGTLRDPAPRRAPEPKPEPDNGPGLRFV